MLKETKNLGRSHIEVSEKSGSHAVFGLKENIFKGSQLYVCASRLDFLFIAAGRKRRNHR